MKAFFRLTLIALASFVAARAGVAQTVKVGTFDKASIVVAFYGSPLWAAKLKEKHAEMELANKQLAGEAPITKILEMLQPVFPAVAAQSKVVLIVPELAYAGSSVEKVDVTDLLLDQLKASSRTRQIVKELRDSHKNAASN
jgi:hypothetical protein